MPLDHDRPGSVQATPAQDHLDLALLEQAAQPPHQALNRLMLSGLGGAPIDRGLGGHHPEVGGVPDRRVHLGDLQPLLGRNAAPEQAGPSRPLVRHQRDRQSEVVGIQGGGVAARASANDHNVMQWCPSPVSADASEPSAVPVAHPCDMSFGRPTGFGAELCSPEGRAHFNRVSGQNGGFRLVGMPTRWLLIASAVTALVIVVAGAIWLCGGGLTGRRTRLAPPGLESRPTT